MTALLGLSLLQAVPQELPSASDAAPHSHIHAAGEIDEDQPPLLVEGSYTADVLVNAAGEVRRDVRYLDNLDLVVEADLDALVGWQGAKLHAYALYNNGAAFSPLVGDAQVVSNIETGVRAVRLYEAWIEQAIGARASLKAGLYDLNSEFDSLTSAGLFTASAHGIGTDISQSGANGPSIFPVTSLAVRGSFAPTEGWVVRGAVLDAVPGDPARPRRTAVKLSEGALLIAELEAPIERGGKLLLGHWRYTDAQDRIDGGRGRGAGGSYIRGEANLFRQSGSSHQGLDGFVRIGTAKGRFYPFGAFASGGLNWTGLIPGRDEDQFGLAVAVAFTSHAERRLRNADRAESAFELTYRLRLGDWISLQPSVHYVVNPNADPEIEDALVLGLRTELSIRLTR